MKTLALIGMAFLGLALGGCHMHGGKHGACGHACGEKCESKGDKACCKGDKKCEECMKKEKAK